MRIAITIALGVALFAATFANAHELALDADRDPTSLEWCPQPEHSGLPVPEQPTPGAFPGPAKNDRMTNFELGSFDLGRELPQLPGRKMRARFWLMEPGGVIGEHCHDDRPAYVYILQGEVEETTWSPAGPIRRTIRAGEAVPERNGTRHWWVNQGRKNVLMVAVDVPRLYPQPTENLPPKTGVTFEELSNMMLRDEYPQIAGVKNYMIRGRLMAFEPGGSTGVEYHSDRPGVAYVISGHLLEHRGDREEREGPAVVRRPGDIAMLTNGLWNHWRNVSQGRATVLIIEFADCGACDREK